MIGTSISIENGRIVLGSLSIKKAERNNKGKSLLSSISDFTAIDIETTGLSPCYDSIIELAAVRYRNGIKSAEYSQLVNPGFEIDDFIIDLTGITNEMLADSPRIEKALPGFIDFIGNDVVVGHNVNFDINFIYDNCTDCGIEPFSNDFIDTMRIAKRLYKDWKSYRLDTLIDNLDLEKRFEHRACNDASLTAEAYMAMCADEGFSDAMILSYNRKAKDIVAEEGFIQEDNPLYGKVCVFTGTLENLTRAEAMQIVTNIGGICADSVTKKTNFLILGNLDYCSSIKGGKSTKQKKAEQLKLSGNDIEILTENVFYDMIFDTEKHEEE